MEKGAGIEYPKKTTAYTENSNKVTTHHHSPLSVNTILSAMMEALMITRTLSVTAKNCLGSCQRGVKWI